MFVVLIAFAATTPAAAVPPAAADNDPVVCRREDSEVGSHMRAKKTCLKKSEWTFVEKNTQRELQELQDKHQSRGAADKPR